MQLLRLLGEHNIKLEIETPVPEPSGEEIEVDADVEEDEVASWMVRDAKMSILRELVDLLDCCGTVGSTNKLFNELWNREKRSSTGVGNGLAIPHVRSSHVKELSLCVAVSREGHPWDAIDEKDVFVFICIVSPPYDDRIYLKLYPEIAKIFSQDHIIQRFLDSWSVHEILQVFREHY